jgi:heme A synthase
MMMGKFETGHLAFASVTLFALSILAFIILGLRRWCVGAEIGGGKVSRVLSALVMISLWMIFIGLNVSNTYAGWDIFTPQMNSIHATQLDANHEGIQLLKAQHNFNQVFEC